MNSRFIAAVVISVFALGFLIASAVQDSKKEVVTVSALLEAQIDRRNVRLGARVAELPIEYQTTPVLELRFAVHDITVSSKSIPVVFNGPMPETLRAGRDVILEGHFVKGEFEAKSLQTQCPSKYEPPQ
jgi:cytochrome c-type biogenesis protein CcmE